MSPISRRTLIKAVPLSATLMFPKISFASEITNQIIDVHHQSPIDPLVAKNAGVVAIIHKATEGGDFRDKSYHSQKKKAKELGLLWGSFHFSNSTNPLKQVENYLQFAKPVDDEVICLDFEHNKGNEMSLEQAEIFINEIFARVGRYPMLYGGAWLREQVRTKPNEILSKCPLWYRRYASTPRELPTKIWDDYTLWQYTDGVSGAEPRSVNGVTCDRNRFKGSVDDLKKAWPFTRRT